MVGITVGTIHSTIGTDHIIVGTLIGAGIHIGVGTYHSIGDIHILTIVRHTIVHHITTHLIMAE